MRDEVRADALLASLEQEHKGKLKVFLGAAPGVGKTYAMLQAVREQAKEGVDILIGVVETHGRQETLALLDKLAIQPRKIHMHRQQRLEEMDLDGLLARKPAIAVVDELAHSNAPGSRHEKRWQDVEELLNAGIDVYSTLNVQHLESLNDLVWQLTGVRVKETLPDQVLLDADSIILIDLPPRSCSAACARGRFMYPIRPRPPCNPSSPSTTSLHCGSWRCKPQPAMWRAICNCNGRRRARPHCRCGAS